MLGCEPGPLCIGVHEPERALTEPSRLLGARGSSIAVYAREMGAMRQGKGQAGVVP